MDRWCARAWSAPVRAAADLRGGQGWTRRAGDGGADQVLTLLVVTAQAVGIHFTTVGDGNRGGRHETKDSDEKQGDNLHGGLVDNGRWMALSEVKTSEIVSEIEFEIAWHLSCFN